jgi:putative nucleotidyltransferase with HDIG domain
MNNIVADCLGRPFDLEMALVDVNQTEQAATIRKGILNSLACLAFSLEAKDRYYRGHSQRVAYVAVAIGRELALDAAVLEQLKLAGLMHDIGKIAIREGILNKDGSLTIEEYGHIISHSIAGERIVLSITEDQMVPLLVRHHHERYDGLGYPDRLEGNQIPIGARILAVSDAYDAMTSDRPYRRALSRRIALRELAQNAGSQFDPEMVNAILGIEEKDLPLTVPGFCAAATRKALVGSSKLLAATNSTR